MVWDLEGEGEVVGRGFVDRGDASMIAEGR